MNRSKQAKVLITDNDVRVRSALQLLLSQEPGFSLVGESADLEQLARKVRELQPDLVLLDWELPGRPAAALLLAFKSLRSQPKVLVLSQRPESREAALTAGADAFVAKSEPPGDLLAACRRLLNQDSQHG
ncbi:MAG: response regulator transcription factor [Anaerolineae bacterium]|jgi:DNA-binding NarL/FixJ family response regulator